MAEKILVIDDDEEFANLLVLLLNKRGYQSKSAYTGKEGIEQAKGFAPAIILQDYMLPDINGLQLLQSLRETNPASQVVIITAKGNEEVAVEIMKAGAADYLKKPFETEKLLTTIENVLKISSSAAAIKKLNHELEQQNQELNWLNAISSALVSNLPAAGKFEVVVEMTLKNLRADLVNLFQYDENKNLKLLASCGDDMEAYQDDGAGRRAGFSFYVSEVKRPVAVASFETEKRFKVPKDILDRGLKSALGVPLVYKNSLKGIISIYTVEERNFSPFDIKLMVSLANLIAMSMENSRLSQVLSNFQKQWQVTFDAVPERIVLQDLEHRVIMANKAAAEDAGMEIKDLIGQVCSWVFHNMKEPVEGCPVEEVRKTKKPVRREIKINNSGDKFEVNAFPVLDDAGNIMLVAEYIKKVQ